MAVNFSISIIPPKNAYSQVKEIRKYFGDSPGLSDPHITLFVNSFRNFSEVDKVLKDIANKHKKFYIEIEKLDAFNEGYASKSKTLIYRVKKTPELISLQNEIVNKTNKLRTKDQERWLLNQNTKYSKEQLDNLEKYGYPFGPKNWIFHTTIVSVSEDQYEKSKKYLNKKDTKYKWKVDSLDLRILLGDDGFQPFKKYKLK